MWARRDPLSGGPLSFILMKRGLWLKKCVSLPELGGHVELVPVDPAAVAVAPPSTRIPARRSGEQSRDILVPRHCPQDLRSRRRALGVHEEPPEARLRLMHRRQAPVVAQHAPELGVGALDAVVGRRPGAAAGAPHLDEREQLARLHQPVEAAPGRAQPLMDVPLPAVLQPELPQEPLPFRMPRRVRSQPPCGPLGVAHLEEPERDAVELLPAGQLGP